MKKCLLVLLALALLTLGDSVFAQGTTFTYQGSLSADAVPANGLFDFEFSLYTNATGTGTQIGSTITQTNIGVTNGSFTVALDFGNVFAGDATWLAIGVRTNGEVNFTALNPLQQLTPTPYALYAPKAGTAETASLANVSSVANSVAGANITGVVSLGHLPSSVVTNTETGITLSGTFAGGGLGLTSLDASALTDGVVSTNVLPGFQPPNYNTISGGDGNSIVGPYGAVAGSFIGGGGWDGSVYSGNAVNDNAAAIVGGLGNIVISGSPYSFIGGGWSNVAGSSSNFSSATYAAIGGGLYNQVNGTGSFVGSGQGNQATGNYSSIGAGYYIVAEGDYSAVAGGAENDAVGDGSFIGGGGWDGGVYSGNYADDVATTIGGGMGNSITYGSPYSFIGGGYGNSTGFNLSGNPCSFIGGGYHNSVNGSNAVVTGGYQNSANANYATVGGGFENSAGGTYASVSGGQNNTAKGSQATISGGVDNIASGLTSIIGGGWTNVASGNNSFIGGGQFNVASGHLATVPGGANNVAEGTCSIACGNGAVAQADNTFVWADGAASTFTSGGLANTFNVRAVGGVWLWSAANAEGAGTAGVELKPNDTSWSVLSDRNAKKNFKPVDTEGVLDKLTSIPIQQWNYKWEKDGEVPNIGPMAQDFKHAFFPGRDDTSINTLEFDGVELAAIQGLNQKLDQRCQSLESQLEKKETEINDLKTKAAQVDSLEKRLNDLEAVVQSLGTKK